MPLYEFCCRTCDDVFELRRPMSAANAPTDCPSGHVDTVRLLSVFANHSAAAGSPAPVAAPAGGGCCGGACGCAH